MRLPGLSGAALHGTSALLRRSTADRDRIEQRAGIRPRQAALAQPLSTRVGRRLRAASRLQRLRWLGHNQGGLCPRPLRQRRDRLRRPRLQRDRLHSPMPAGSPPSQRLHARPHAAPAELRRGGDVVHLPDLRRAGSPPGHGAAQFEVERLYLRRKLQRNLHLRQRQQQSHPGQHDGDAHQQRARLRADPHLRDLSSRHGKAVRHLRHRLARSGRKRAPNQRQSRLATARKS